MGFTENDTTAKDFAREWLEGSKQQTLNKIHGLCADPEVTPGQMGYIIGLMVTLIPPGYSRTLFLQALKTKYDVGIYKSDCPTSLRG